MSVSSLILESLPMLEAAVVAAVIASIVAFLIGAWPWRSPNPARAAMGLTFGVGCGFFAACYYQGMQVRLTVAEAQDRLLLILLPAVLLVEIVGAFVRRATWLIWLLRVAIAAAIVPLLLDGSTYVVDREGMPREWSVAEIQMNFTVLAVFVAIGWVALYLLGRRCPGGSAPLSLAAACFATAACVAFSGYRTGSPIGIALAGSLAGAAVISAILPKLGAGNGAISFGVVGLAGLLTIGRFFGTLTTINATMLFAAPLLCWCLEAPPRIRGFGRVVVAAAPLAFVVLVAQQKFAEESARTSGASKPSSSTAAEGSPQDYLDFGK